MEIILLIVALFLFLSVLKPWTIGRRERNLPPGPPTTLLVGNALQFPQAFAHLQFTEWAKQYGEIVSLKILNMTMIVLSSAASVKSVLDKQGSVTGNRPQTHMLNVATEGNYMIMANMDSVVWRKGRKSLHAFLTPELLDRYAPAQRAESIQLLYDLLNDPKDIWSLIRRTTSSFILQIIFSKRCPTFLNSEAECWFTGITLINQISDPVAHPPIDAFPLLKHTPMRWAPWKQLCERAKKLRNDLFSSLLAQVEDSLKEGHSTGCYAERLLETQGEHGMTWDEMKSMCMVMMDGGAETTASYLQTFILALINNPSSQRKAHSEIDEIVGSDRLPTGEDLERLTYVKALIKEVHRIRPVFPIGVPHVATSDLKYKDYHIPKGSIIFQNSWGIFHDPKLFEDPASFKPERYLHSALGMKNSVDEQSLAFRENLLFGAGRRICPGEELSSRTISLNVMLLLWAFDFSKDNSGTGSMDWEFYVKPGTELGPKRFSCNIKVRGDNRAILINKAFANTF